MQNIIDPTPKIPRRVGMCDGNYLAIAAGYVNTNTLTKTDRKHAGHLMPNGMPVGLYRAPAGDLGQWLNNHRQPGAPALDVTDARPAEPSTTRWHNPPVWKAS